ncbi:helix-turn-helix domain-containing protein [Streptomyces sp. 4.24]|uniref:helix-turn-helix domain-containing protein n=1 Tax=Streptomyces tritrimontium TaxID=3406573 RepID=UPI003BB591D9
MDRDLERLATAVRKRRTELGLGIEPAAKLAGISKDTWKRVEPRAGAHAQEVRDTSYAAIDRALQWAPGSCFDVLAGRGPTLSEPAGEPGVRATHFSKEQLETVGDAVQSATLGWRGDLTSTEVLELNERVLQELRRRGAV